MKNKKLFIRPTHDPRRGSMTIELILIFPLVLLVLFLFFQMSVVLLTWHSLHATVTFAGNVASEATGADAQAAVTSASRGWYYATPAVEYCASSSAWNSTSKYFKIRVLSRGTVAAPATQWSYVTDTATIAPGTVLRVELKLCDMSTHFPQYWLVGQFQGVNTDRNRDSITVSNTVLHQ